eukprot:Clim_evm18s8 gene=Clim_evmTU18s8
MSSQGTLGTDPKQGVPTPIHNASNGESDTYISRSVEDKDASKYQNRSLVDISNEELSENKLGSVDFAEVANSRERMATASASSPILNTEMQKDLRTRAGSSGSVQQVAAVYEVSPLATNANDDAKKSESAIAAEAEAVVVKTTVSPRTTTAVPPIVTTVLRATDPSSEDVSTKKDEARRPPKAVFKSASDIGISTPSLFGGSQRSEKSSKSDISKVPAEGGGRRRAHTVAQRSVQFAGGLDANSNPSEVITPRSYVSSVLTRSGMGNEFPQGSSMSIHGETVAEQTFRRLRSKSEVTRNQGFMLQQMQMKAAQSTDDLSTTDFFHLIDKSFQECLDPESLDAAGGSRDQILDVLNNAVNLLKRTHIKVKGDQLSEESLDNLVETCCRGPSEVRAAVFRVCRYVMADDRACERFIDKKMHIFFTQGMCRSQPEDLERSHALRAVRQMLVVSPNRIPRSVIAALVTISEHHDEKLRHIALQTLAECAVKNVDVVAMGGGIRVLVKALSTSTTPQLSHALSIILASIMTYPSTRKYLSNGVDLWSLLSVYTDTYVMESKQKLDNALPNPRAPPGGDTEQDHADDERYISSQYAIVAMCRYWPGLLALCSSTYAMKSVVDILRMPRDEMRSAVIDMLFELFQVSQVDETLVWRHGEAGDSDQTLGQQQRAGIKNRQGAAGFGPIDDGVVSNVAASGAMLRYDVIDGYVAILLQYFAEIGMFDALAEVISCNNTALGERALLLCRRLLQLATFVLPASVNMKLQTMPRLVTIAASADANIYKRSRANVAVGLLDRIEQQVKFTNTGNVPGGGRRSVGENKPHRAEGSIVNLGRGSVRREISVDAAGLERHLALSKHTTNEAVDLLSENMDDSYFQLLLKESGLLNKELLPPLWNWELIHDMIIGPMRNVRRFEDATVQRCLRKLVAFFKPIGGYLADSKTDPNNIYFKTGIALIDLFVSRPHPAVDHADETGHMDVGEDKHSHGYRERFLNVSGHHKHRQDSEGDIPVAQSISHESNLGGVASFSAANLTTAAKSSMFMEWMNELRSMLEDFHPAIRSGGSGQERTIPEHQHVLDPTVMASSLSVYHLWFLGRLTHHEPGRVICHKLRFWSAWYIFFSDLAYQREDLIQTLLESFSYAERAGHTRILLGRIAAGGPKPLRLWLAGYMSDLYGYALYGTPNAGGVSGDLAEPQEFIEWFLGAVEAQLYDADTDIAHTALDLLDILSDEEEVMEMLVQRRPAVVHMGGPGLDLLHRIMRHPVGFRWLLDVGHVEEQLAHWTPCAAKAAAGDLANPIHIAENKEDLRQSMNNNTEPHSSVSDLPKDALRSTADSASTLGRATPRGLAFAANRHLPPIQIGEYGRKWVRSLEERIDESLTSSLRAGSSSSIVTGRAGNGYANNGRPGQIFSQSSSVAVTLNPRPPQRRGTVGARANRRIGRVGSHRGRTAGAALRRTVANPTGGRVTTEGEQIVSAQSLSNFGSGGVGSVHGLHGIPTAGMLTQFSAVDLPPHFMGSLAATAEGREILKREGSVLKTFRDLRHITIEALQKQDYQAGTGGAHGTNPDDGPPPLPWPSEMTDSSFQPLALKAQIWTLAQVGSEYDGQEVLGAQGSLSDVVRIMVLLASRAPLISVRGTAYFALGCLGRNPRCQPLLERHGWHCVIDARGVYQGICVPDKAGNFLRLQSYVPDSLDSDRTGTRSNLPDSRKGRWIELSALTLQDPTEDIKENHGDSRNEPDGSDCKKDPPEPSTTRATEMTWPVCAPDLPEELKGYVQTEPGIADLSKHMGQLSYEVLSDIAKRGLRKLQERHPAIFSDPRAYAVVWHDLNVYTFKLDNRRFIEEMFTGLQIRPEHLKWLQDVNGAGVLV